MTSGSALSLAIKFSRAIFWNQVTTVKSVLLSDETTFAMGSDGRMTLDEMVYDPATQEGSVSMSVLQGVFTYVSGQVVYVSRQWMTIAQCLSGEQTMASVPALDEFATAAGAGDSIVHQF